MSSSERASSPTPSEREKLDAEARKKEEAEQAALPYKWTQTIGEVDVSIPVPGNLKGRDLIVEIKKTRIKAQVKGQEPLIEVCLRSFSVFMILFYRESLSLISS
jgi:CS domain